MANIYLTRGGKYVLSSVNGEMVLTNSGIFYEPVVYTGPIYFEPTYGFQINNAPVDTSITGDSGLDVYWDSSTKRIWPSSSTKKLKKDIVPLSSAIPLDQILDIQSRSFKWKSDDSQDAGFIAEEVAEVNPLFARHGADWSYDEKGEKIKMTSTTSESQTFQKDSDNIAPAGINVRAILAAAVEKIKDLNSRTKILENKKRN
jgi:hypothetical protein